MTEHQELRAQHERVDQPRLGKTVSTEPIWRNIEPRHIGSIGKELMIGFNGVLPPVLASRLGTVSNAFNFCKSNFFYDQLEVDVCSSSLLASTLTDTPRVVQGFICKLFPISKVAEEHAQWVVTNASSSPALVSALVSVGAATLLSFKDSDVSTGTRAKSTQLSSHDLIVFKNVTLSSLNAAINNAEARPEILIYSIMCLMIAEVRLDAI